MTTKMLYTDNNGRTSALPLIVAGMILLSLCAANFAVLHCEAEETEKKEAESKAGDLLELTIKDVKFRFRCCPAGTFTMGSPSSEKNRDNNETPHQVTLTQGFWMLETEVTQDMWKTVMAGNRGYFKGAKLPVESVSWSDCQEFVEKLNALGTAPKGYKFSLPTEAQWEYACRAGTTGAYAGDLDRMAWHRYNGERTTHEVGTKKANAWGLYDMHGNVWEWCNDWYGDYPADDVTDPVGASSGSSRVYRGGSWFIYPRFCRSAFRDSDAPDDASSRLGVRVALVSEQ